jgi:preprotein translocase subunit SecA
VIETSLKEREQEFGLYTFLFYVRQIYLREIDDQWIAHLKNIEQLRAGIGLIGYASRNPKNEYKLRGFELFREMWENIERTVLDQILRMRLSEEDRQRAEEGAEYDTTLTRASVRREKSTAARRGGNELDKLQSAARRAVEKLKEATGAAVSAATPKPAAAQAPAPSPTEDAEAAFGRAVAKVAGGQKQEFPNARPNDPCPCGSGKRFKKCHGKNAAAVG